VGVVKIPFKIKIFMWLVHKKRILTKNHLLKRGWVGDLSYIFYGQHGTIDHLLVNCSISRVIWEWIATFNNFHFWGQKIRGFMNSGLLHSIER
jgi:zinc-binding in reverse transcriptase